MMSAVTGIQPALTMISRRDDWAGGTLKTRGRGRITLWAGGAAVRVLFDPIKPG